MNKTIIIAIIDYELELTKEIDEAETRWKIKNDEKMLTDIFEIRIIELGKVKREYERNNKNPKLQWLMFLNNPRSFKRKSYNG